MSRQLTEAWGQFLSQFPWDWFVTLTFKTEVVSFRAHRQFSVFVREIEIAAGVPVFWFRADEVGARGGRFHIHALIGNVAHLRRMTWMDRWAELAGYARILPFDSRRGAAYYCAKYVAKRLNDWDLSDDLTAFAQYQPVLPLEGGSKARPGHAEQSPRKRHSAIRPAGHLQTPMPYLVKGLGSSRDRDVSSVYRSEVTRGRGKFRDFGFGI